MTLLALQWRSKGSDDLIEPELDVQQSVDGAPEPEDDDTLREDMKDADAEPVFTFPVRRENSKVVLWTDAMGSPDLSGWLLAWGYQLVRCPAELETQGGKSSHSSHSVMDAVVEVVVRLLLLEVVLVDLHSLKSAVMAD